MKFIVNFNPLLLNIHVRLNGLQTCIQNLCENIVQINIFFTILWDRSMEKFILNSVPS